MNQTNNESQDIEIYQLRERIATLERELSRFLKDSNGETLQELFDKGKLAESEFESCLLCGYQSELAIWIDPTLVVNGKRYGVCLSCRSKVNAYDKTALEVLNLIAERDTARADCKLHMESFLTVANAMGTPEAHPQKIANEIAALRAEAADLRAQLAERHTLADMAAGLLAEKGELKKLLSECRILVDRKTIRVGPPHPDDDHWIWKDLLKRIDSALQPEAHRPEAEGREG